MNLTWIVGRPTGKEQGTFLTLDMGGSHIRVCKVKLQQNGQSDVAQKNFPVPRHLKSGTAEELWNYLADCVWRFIEQGELDANGKRHQLAFTFSFPVTQDAIDHGVLQRWTKGFDVSGVEGHNVIEQFKAAFKRKVGGNYPIFGGILFSTNIPKDIAVDIPVVINDTTGTLLASIYVNKDTDVGSIIGTGCNSAYMEDCSCIQKLSSKDRLSDSLMAINCEYGAFDNEHVVLPRTHYDIVVDEESPRPGQQSYEKMNSGLYLGEIFRHILLDLHNKNVLFIGKTVSKLTECQSIESSNLSKVDNPTPADIRDIFEPALDIPLEEYELRVCHYIAILLNTRAARLCACGFAAICKKRRLKSCHIGADGAVVVNNDFQRKRLVQALLEILDWAHLKEPPVTLDSVEGGSSVGAAIAAAMANTHQKET